MLLLLLLPPVSSYSIVCHYLFRHTPYHSFLGIIHIWLSFYLKLCFALRNYFQTAFALNNHHYVNLMDFSNRVNIINNEVDHCICNQICISPRPSDVPWNNTTCTHASTTPTKHCLIYVQTLVRRKLLWCPECDYLYSDHVPVDWYDALGWWSGTDEPFSHAIYFGHSKWIYHSIIITKNLLFRTCIFAVASVCQVFVTTSRHQAKWFCYESRFGITKHFFQLGLYEILYV